MLRSSRNADRLPGVRHGQRRNQIGLGVSQGGYLLTVVPDSLSRLHQRRRAVRVIARADTAADHERGSHSRLVAVAKPGKEGDRLAVQSGELFPAVAQPRRPPRTGPPRGSLGDEPSTGLRRDIHVEPVVPQQPIGAVGIREEHESGELRQVHALVEDQRRL